MVTAGIITVVYNERRTVTTARALDEGLQKVYLPENIDVPFEENNGKLILMSGSLNIQDDLEDPLYGIKIKAVKLKKWVQMYQWYETTDAPKSEEEKHHSYSYAQDWFDYPISSISFSNTLGMYLNFPAFCLVCKKSAAKFKVNIFF